MSKETCSRLTVAALRQMIAAMEQAGVCRACLVTALRQEQERLETRWEQQAACAAISQESSEG